MNWLRVDPSTYDIWSALPTYFNEHSPFYIEGAVSGPTAFIEIIGHGLVAEAEVMLTEMTIRPKDKYWLTEATSEIGMYSLVDVLQLDFHHPLLQMGMYELDSYEVIKAKWDRGYQVPSARWTRETYEYHLSLENQSKFIASSTVCEKCGHDLKTRYGVAALQLIEFHVEGESGIWVCPTCHKSIHYFE